jgi:uncharacterized protein (DUF305 family)
MQKNTAISIVAITLIVGLGIGYGIGANKAPVALQQSGGGHMMSMEDSMINMNAGLQGKAGDAFDQAFLAEMIVHHQGAVEMAQSALTNAKHQEIKDLASVIISAQNEEIAQMKAWQVSWYGQR